VADLSRWHAGPWAQGVEFDTWLDRRLRTPVVYQYPGEDVRFGPAEKQLVFGVALSYTLRFSISRLSFLASVGPAAQYTTDGDAARWLFGASLGLGGTVYILRPGRISSTWIGLTARARFDAFANDFMVTDYQFSLAGAPGPSPRTLGTDTVTFSAGAEVWF
jgi:hypothetical protein